jgi:hypothetical protein
LKRAQIYGAIAFYLDHQAEIEEYLALSANSKKARSHCGRRIRNFGESWNARVPRWVSLRDNAVSDFIGYKQAGRPRTVARGFRIIFLRGQR